MNNALMEPSGLTGLAERGFAILFGKSTRALDIYFGNGKLIDCLSFGKLPLMETTPAMEAIA